MRALAILSATTAVTAAAVDRREAQFDLSVLFPKGADMGKILKDFSPGGIGSVPPAILTMEPVLPRAKVAHREAAQAEIRQEAKRTIVRFGPYHMSGQKEKRPVSFSMDPKGQAFISVIESNAGLCDTEPDCTILRSTTNLVFADGSPAGPDQGIYVHHLLASDINKKVKVPVTACDYDTVDLAKLPFTNSPSAPFISQGEDNGKSPTLYTSTDGKYESGFHLRKNDKFIMQADLVNYNDEGKDVYVSMDVEYLPGISGEDATSNLMSVVGCKFAQPLLNKTGVAITQSKLFPILVNGTIIAAKGHMHDGGEKMTLMVNDKHVCDSVPNYLGNDIHGMSVCELNIKVRPGDTISMSSVYDLSKHPLRMGVGGMPEHDWFGGDDVMGMWTLTFAYDKPA